MVKLEDTKASEYDDIINLPHYEPSKKYTRMSLYNRSAQFAPFSALTGYDDAVEETGRITNSKIELDESEKQEISNILNKIEKNQEIKVTYFVKDNKKLGGKYIERICTIKKIDYINKKIILSSKEVINIDDIIKIGNP